MQHKIIKAFSFSSHSYIKILSFIFYNIFRLDRKSSRGMVFENEELRLRTINISADVERGKSS